MADEAGHLADDPARPHHNDLDYALGGDPLENPKPAYPADILFRKRARNDVPGHAVQRVPVAGNSQHFIVGRASVIEEAAGKLTE